MASDDWARNPPTTVDIRKLLQRNPRHANCDLTIHSSPKAFWYVGLYCCQHDHWLTWINPYQTHYLESLGIENPHDCPSKPSEQDQI